MLFHDRPSLFNMFYHSNMVIQGMDYLANAITEDAKLLKKDVENNYYKREKAEFISKMCKIEAHKYDIEKLMLVMMEKKIEKKFSDMFRNRFVKCYEIIENLEDSYSKIVFNNEFSYIKPINKFEYHCEQFGYEV